LSDIENNRRRGKESDESETQEIRNGKPHDGFFEIYSNHPKVEIGMPLWPVKDIHPFHRTGERRSTRNPVLLFVIKKILFS